jgi:hypothetical protein
MSFTNLPTQQTRDSAVGHARRFNRCGSGVVRRRPNITLEPTVREAGEVVSRHGPCARTAAQLLRWAGLK